MKLCRIVLALTVPTLCSVQLTGSLERLYHSPQLPPAEELYCSGCSVPQANSPCHLNSFSNLQDPKSSALQNLSFSSPRNLSSSAALLLCSSIDKVRGNHGVSAPEPGLDSVRPSLKLQLRLRGGVGAPKDIGAPGYDNHDFMEKATRVLGYSQQGNLGMMKMLLEADGQEEEAKCFKGAPKKIIVPGTYRNMSAAITQIYDVHQVSVKKGDHRWEGRLELRHETNVTLNVKGQHGARLLGRWLLPKSAEWPANSAGNFADVTCAYASENYTYVEDLPDSLFTVLGGPWKFHRCELRAASADVFAACFEACLVIDACRLGGMGTPFQLNGSMTACSGLDCTGSSSVTLSSSVIEMCGNYGGGSLVFQENAKANVSDCEVLGSLLGLFIDDEALVSVSSCVFKGNYGGHLQAGENASLAQLRVRGTELYEGMEQGFGDHWMSEVRPGVYEEKNTQFIPGYSANETEFNSSISSDVVDIPSSQLSDHPDMVGFDRIWNLTMAEQERVMESTYDSFANLVNDYEE